MPEITILPAQGCRRSRKILGYLELFGFTLFGVLFSLYLTYLEPFVIRAVCIWCLISAVIITLLLLLSLDPAVQAITATDDDQ